MTKLKIGDYNELEILRTSLHGMFLSSSEGDILLPKRYVTESMQPGQMVEVFVYTDSQDRLVAVTDQPKARVGDFASLLVKDVTTVGAFLDWGLEKDLMLPYREQLKPVQTGEKVVVKVILDPRTKRVIAISKINAFISKTAQDLEEGQPVSLLIFDQTPLGYKALIDQQYQGLIYKNEVFEPLSIGDEKKGFVKKVREDGHIDLSLQQQGVAGMKDAREVVLQSLQQAGGFLPLHDKSSPEDIQRHLQLSKKAFKKAVGILYKERKIQLDDKGISLL
ncbi:MAG: S1 RNA-binding domain-containing protein [Cyclobacteriaceae bacterium]